MKHGFKRLILEKPTVINITILPMSIMIDRYEIDRKWESPHSNQSIIFAKNVSAEKSKGFRTYFNFNSDFYLNCVTIKSPRFNRSNRPTQLTVRLACRKKMNYYYQQKRWTLIECFTSDEIKWHGSMIENIWIIWTRGQTIWTKMKAIAWNDNK